MSVAPWHLLILLIVAGGGLALWISAIVSIARRAGDRTAQVLWLLAVFIFPFLGPLAWFVIGRPGTAQALS